MNEEKKQIIWSTNDYFDEEAMNKWWQEQIELQDINTEDLADKIGIDTDSLNEEQKQALETLLPLYKEKQCGKQPNIQEWRTLINDYLDDVRANLNKEVDGIIVCVADLGLWDGRRIGIKAMGENIKDILYSECDDVTWYSDGKDIQCDAGHHDGANHYLYRVAKDYETYKELESLVYRGELTFENVIKATKSLHPYVAEVYGWAIEEEKKVA